MAISGSFTLQQQLQATAAGNWPVLYEPYFYDVTLLLNGDGTNGAQNNTFLDSSTNNFTITRNGNTTQGSFSPYGNLWGNYFPAGGNYAITTPASTNTSLGSGDFTIEAWAFTTSFGAYYNMLACKWDYPNKEWYLAYTASSITLGLSTNGTADSATFTASTTVPLNTWCHIAITRSGSNLYTFLNGQLVATNSISQTFYASSIVTAIGNFPSSGISDTGMRGYISNFRLVKGTALYTSSFTPSTTPLTAISGTQLLTCQSNRYLDNSSNNFTVTPTSSNSIQRFSPFNPTAPYSTSVIGGSGYFNRSGASYLTTSYNANLLLNGVDSTIEGWFYLNSASGAPGSSQPFFNQSLIPTNASPSNCNFFCFADGTNLYLGGNGDSAYYATPASNIPLKQWFHLAIVFSSGTSATLYINGVSQSLSGSMNAIGNNTSYSTNIGYVVTGGGAGTITYLDGYASNIRIVKGSKVYTANFTPPTAPLTAITNTQLLTNFTNAGIPDLAMQNNLETVGNAQVSTSVKKYGTGSLAFDGTGDYLYCPSSPIYNFNGGVGNITLEAWINPSVLSSSSYGIMGNHSAPSDQKTLFYVYSTGAIAIGRPAVNEIASTTGLISTGTWYHVAAVLYNGTTTIYLNGTSVASGTTAVWSSGALTFTVGYNAYANNWNGYIDDLRITNGLARYTATFTPPTQALPTY